MHIANQPTPRHIAHDVFNRGKSSGCIRLVVHGQENAGDDLNHQHQHGQNAKEIQEIEIFGRVIFAQMFFVKLGQRESVVYPVQRFFRHWGVRGNFFEFSHGVRL
jgi:hypothetical protein